MPVIKSYQHGSTSGTPPMKNDHQRAPRGTTQGWTDRAVRSNLAFLRSVTLSELTGTGYSFTLTVRDCPESAEEWQKMRRRFVKRLERFGLIRLHWVTEWQRRGVPHLHGVAYFPDDETHPYPKVHSAIITAWCSIAWIHTASEWAQDCKPITDALGWLQYLAKHAARGKNHYQRSADNIPAGWQKTGRVWGKSGDWPTAEPLVFNLDDPGYWQYRRLVRQWRIAKSRAAGNGRQIRSARRMLQANTREKAQVRGTSEWISQRLSLQMLAFLAGQGHHIEH